MPANIQNVISSIDVIILVVLKDFLIILNISNRTPIKTPFMTNITNKYA